MKLNEVDEKFADLFEVLVQVLSENQSHSKTDQVLGVLMELANPKPKQNSFEYILNLRKNPKLTFFTSSPRFCAMFGLSKFFLYL